MKNKVRINPFLRIFIFVSVLAIIALATAIGLFYYAFSIPEPEGLSLASWPHTFTENFSLWMEHENDNIRIKEIGLERLDEYGLWIQVIDEKGQEVYSYHKPETYKTNYTASELITLKTGVYENGNTVFANSYTDSEKTWSYIIGFPYNIGKYMLYYNGGNLGRLLPVFRIGILFILCVVILLVFVYGFWLTKHLRKITNGIGNVSLRAYTPLKEKGIFSGIYAELNKMNMEIHHSDKVEQDTERVRREWITNITHDLKTPLSPVKGYAELLTAGPMPEYKTVNEYGKIILKNVNYAEKLINDLKLTYQLDSGAIPYHPQAVQLIRYLKELVIDVVNDPAFHGRNIEFESCVQEFTLSIDPDLFRRAVQNLIINALIHNPPETIVTVTVGLVSYQDVTIIIRDNGIGMSEIEQSELFSRYYRGTNTGEKPEGSGLGLAIAKQIITLHSGELTVKSQLKQGTEFIISLPLPKE